MQPLVIICLLVSAVLAVDYYEVLGVGRDATDRELKKAYRALSRQFHPDKNRGDPTAEQKFIEVSEAYEILSNPESRQIFDRYGEEGLKNGGNGFGGMHHDPMDLFHQFFGGSMFRDHQPGVRRGPNTAAYLPVSLMDTYNGNRVEFELKLKGICDECDGSGSADGKRKKCTQCGGNGQRVIRHQIAPGVFQQVQTVCETCKGQGTVIEKPCSVCHGERVVDEDRKYNVFVEPGSARQWDYVLEGEGDQNPDWVPGNLIIHVIQSNSDNLGYRRRGPHLFREEVVSIKDAVEGGWTREITRLDNETVLTIGKARGESIYNDMVDIIKGEGLPIPKTDSKGDLYIRYLVVGQDHNRASSSQNSNLHDDL